MRLLTVIGLLLFAVGTAGCREAQSYVPPPAVATVGEAEIPAELFRKRYLRYLLKAGLADTPQLRQTYLEGMIRMKRIALEARAAGAADTPAFQYQAEQMRRKLLLDRFAQTMLFDTLQVTQAELEAMFVRINTKVTARHLYARTLPQAEALAARLAAGASFEALAEEVFVDPQLAASGGSVGTFGFDEMDPAFEDAAFTLQIGEISGPVRTAQGYSLIQVQDRLVESMLTETEFAQKKDRLETYVRYRKQGAARNAFVHDLAEALNPAYHDATLDQLLGQITGTALMDSEQDLAQPLVTFGLPGDRATWTVASFRDVARFTSPRQRAQVQTRADLVDFIEGLVVQAEMLRRAEAAGLDAQPAFTIAYEAALDDALFDQARQRLVDEMTLTDADLQAFYEQEKGAYLQPARVHVREIAVASKPEAERLKAQLTTTAFADLARQHSLRAGADETGGDLGYLTRHQLGVFGDAAFAAQPGTVLGPLEAGGRYMLLQVGDQQPPYQPTFEELRPRLEAALRQHRTDAVVRAHAAGLAAQYPAATHGLLGTLSLTEPVSY